MNRTPLPTVDEQEQSMKSTMQDWSDPLARLRQAANQVVAESMAAVHCAGRGRPYLQVGGESAP